LAEGVGRWWNTVRCYGGTHTGIYPKDNSPQRVGPFTGRKVAVDLSDFHCRFHRSGRSAASLPDKTVAPVISEETELRIFIDISVTEPMLLLLRQPETEGTSQ
jgi:hypothetical protein